MKHKDIKAGMVVAVKTGNHYLHRTRPDLVKATVVSPDRYGKSGGWGMTTIKRESGQLIEVETGGHARFVSLGQIKGEWDPVGIKWESDIARLDEARALRFETANAACDLALRLALELTALGYPAKQDRSGLSMDAATAAKLIAAVKVTQ